MMSQQEEEKLIVRISLAPEMPHLIKMCKSVMHCVSKEIEQSAVGIDVYVDIPSECDEINLTHLESVLRSLVNEKYGKIYVVAINAIKHCENDKCKNDTFGYVHINLRVSTKVLHTIIAPHIE